jgi:hypothetical protein
MFGGLSSPFGCPYYQKTGDFSNNRKQKNIENTLRTAILTENKIAPRRFIRRRRIRIRLRRTSPCFTLSA